MNYNTLHGKYKTKAKVEKSTSD